MSRDGPQRRQGATEKKERWSGTGALKRPSIRAFLPPEKEAGIHEWSCFRTNPPRPCLELDLSPFVQGAADGQAGQIDKNG